MKVMAKRILVLVLSLFIALISSCSMDQHTNQQEDQQEDQQTNDSLDISRINFAKYSSFSKVSFDDAQSNRSRDFSADGTKFLGYDFSTDSLEELLFTTESGDNYSVSSFRKIGEKYLWLELTFDLDQQTKLSYLIDVQNNKAFDLTDNQLSDSFHDEYIYEYEDGLILRSGDYRNSSLFKLNVNNNEIIPINNTTYDGLIEDFYATKSGHVLAGAFIENNYVSKYYPTDGSAPLTYGELLRWTIRYRDTSIIGSSSVDYLIDLASKKKYEFTNTGINFSSLDPSEYPGVLCGRLIVSTRTSGGSNPVRYYKTESGSNIYYTGSEIIHCYFVDGNLVIDRYPIPEDMSIEGFNAAAVIGDFIIYEITNVGLYCYNFKTESKTVIYEGQIAEWATLGDGVSYSKYNSATSVESLFFDLNTKETTHLADSIASVIDAVWFPLG